MEMMEKTGDDQMGAVSEVGLVLGMVMLMWPRRLV